jgi:hypothetical protein
MQRSIHPSNGVHLARDFYYFFYSILLLDVPDLARGSDDFNQTTSFLHSTALNFSRESRILSAAVFDSRLLNLLGWKNISAMTIFSVLILPSPLKLGDTLSSTTRSSSARRRPAARGCLPYGTGCNQARATLVQMNRKARYSFDDDSL